MVRASVAFWGAQNLIGWAAEITGQLLCVFAVIFSTAICFLASFTIVLQKNCPAQTIGVILMGIGYKQSFKNFG